MEIVNPALKISHYLIVRSAFYHCNYTSVRFCNMYREDRKEWTHFSNAVPEEIRNIMQESSLGLMDPDSPQ